MKNTVALAVILSVVFLSCEKAKSTTETAAKVSVEPLKQFAVDSIHIKDSLKIDQNLTVGFRSGLLIFPTITNKVLLDSIYAPKNIRLDDYSKTALTNALDQKKKQYYEEQKKSLLDYKPEFAQNWEENSAMKLFSNDNDFITVQYSTDGYTGGAHGYYGEIYKVFDLKANKAIQLSDVVSNQETILWDKILMDNFLKNDLDKDQAEMLLVKEIPLNSNFYFDKENLYFLYNQYEITAYAAGTVLIKIPLSDIKPLLTDEFINRQGL